MSKEDRQTKCQIQGKEERKEKRSEKEEKNNRNKTCQMVVEKSSSSWLSSQKRPLMIQRGTSGGLIIRTRWTKPGKKCNGIRTESRKNKLCDIVNTWGGVASYVMPTGRPRSLPNETIFFSFFLDFRFTNTVKNQTRVLLSADAGRHIIEAVWLCSK